MNAKPTLSTRLASGEGGLDMTLLVSLMRLLVDGEPVEISTLARTLGWTEDQVKASLAAMPDTEYDVSGRVVGQGLTLRPTPHRFTVDGQELYTWCALDTLMFPELLGRGATVDSVSPTSGRAVHLRVEPDGPTHVDPASAVVSLVNPDKMTSIRSSFCNQVHFFVSAEDAEPWLQSHPDGEVLPVQDAYRFGHTLTAVMLEHPRE